MKGVARQIDKGGSSVFKIYGTIAARELTDRHTHINVIRKKTDMSMNINIEH